MNTTATIPWHRAAACRNEPPALFSPRGETGDYPGQITEAKTICRRCPVKEQCLDEALHIEGTSGIYERQGIYGGTTPRERHAIARQRKASQRQKEAA